MTRNTIWGALLVALLTAACGAPTGNGADNVDASTSTTEVAVTPDRPLPRLDVASNDAGPATRDVQNVADSGSVTPPTDRGMMDAPLSDKTMNRINMRCWGFPGERCERIVARLRGADTILTMPLNLGAVMGFSRARCYTAPSGEGVCDGQAENGTPTDGHLRGLGPVMDFFTHTCPGQPDRTVEGRPL